MKTRKARVVRLGPPVGYMGGKRMFAPAISAWILARKPEYVFDLCCGSGAISIALVQRGFPADRLTMVDIGPWGSFWKSLVSGSFNFDWVQDFLFRHWPQSGDPAIWLEKISQELPETPEAFIVLQWRSFGSMPVYLKEGHWRGGGRTRSYKADEGTKLTRNSRMALVSLLRAIQKKLRGATTIHGDVTAAGSPWFSPPPGSVIYLDPPYSNTNGYGPHDVGFNAEEFARTCPRPLLISEQRSIGGASRVIDIGGRAAKGLGQGRTSVIREYLNIFD